MRDNLINREITEKTRSYLTINNLNNGLINSTLKINIIIAGLLFCLTSISQAGTLYIDDNLRVGVRSEHSSQSAPFKVINSGATVELIKKSGDYSYIRTSDGKKGWVRSRYLSKTPPAKLLLQELEVEHNKTQQELAQLQQKLKTTDSEKQQLSHSLEFLNKDIKILNNKLAELTPDKDNTLFFLATTFIAFLALAFTLGILWNKQQVAKKLGGHTL